jgi:hypothetical protein
MQLLTLLSQLFISFTDSGIGGTKNTPFPVLLLKSLLAAALYLDTLSRLLAFRRNFESSQSLPSLWKNNSDTAIPIWT